MDLRDGKKTGSERQQRVLERQEEDEEQWQEDTQRTDRQNVQGIIIEEKEGATVSAVEESEDEQNNKEKEKTETQVLEKGMNDILQVIMYELEKNRDEIRRDKEEMKQEIKQCIKQNIKQCVEQLEIKIDIMRKDVTKQQEIFKKEINQKIEIIKNEIKEDRKEVRHEVMTVNEKLEEGMKQLRQEQVEERNNLMKEIEEARRTTTGNRVITTCHSDNVNKFEGDISKMHPITFIRSIQNKYKHLNNMDEIKEIIRNNLVGHALLWFTSRESELLAKQQFEQQFLEYFWSESTQSIVREKLFFGKFNYARSNNLNHYALQIYTSAKFLSPIISEEDIVMSIARHFRPEVAEIIALQNIRNFSQLSNYLLRVERTLNNSQRINNTYRTNSNFNGQSNRDNFNFRNNNNTYQNNRNQNTNIRNYNNNDRHNYNQRNHQSYPNNNQNNRNNNYDRSNNQSNPNYHFQRTNSEGDIQRYQERERERRVNCQRREVRQRDGEVETERRETRQHNQEGESSLRGNSLDRNQNVQNQNF